MADPLTIRYNNPGALEFKPWMQKYGATLGPNGRYAAFANPDQGYGVMSKVLDTYGQKHGLTSVSGIVNRWAPPNVDNNSTGDYIKRVSSTLGIDPNAPVPPERRAELMRAMAAVEAGRAPAGLSAAQPPMMLGGPKDAPTGGQPMALSDPQNQGFSLDNWVSSPLFQMGAGVLGAPNIGQGLMMGSKAASDFASARQKQQKESELFPLQKQLLQAQVNKANQPPTSQDLTEYAAARAQELEAGRQPPSILQFLARKKAQGNGRTPIMGIGPDGRPVAMVIGDNPDGTPALLNAAVPSGFSIDPRNVTKVDTGTGTELRGNDGRVIAAVPKDIAGAKVAAEVGEASGKAIAGLPKAEQALRSYEAQQGIVTQEIDKALAAADGGYSTGLTGALARKMPGTAAYDLARTLDTIKANIGFDKLQQMRNESPTGGALGGIAVQELEMLQAVLGSVEQAQSKEQLKANLARMKEVIASFGQRRRQAYEEDVKRYGGAVVGPPNVPINVNPSGQASPFPDAGTGVRVLRKLD